MWFVNYIENRQEESIIASEELQSHSIKTVRFWPILVQHP